MKNIETKNIEIKNATQHTVNVFVGGKEVMALEPSGILPRVEQEEVVIETINGVPITRQKFSKPYGLPEKEEGVFWIVSKLTAEAANDREDLLVPGPMVRGENGKPVGCNGLSRI